MELEELKVLISVKTKEATAQLSGIKEKFKNVGQEAVNVTNKINKATSSINPGTQAVKNQMDNLAEKIRLTNAQIDIQKDKLAQLQGQLAGNTGEADRLRARYAEINSILSSTSKTNVADPALIQEQIDLYTRLQELKAKEQKPSSINTAKVREEILKVETRINKLSASADAAKGKLNSLNSKYSSVNNSSQSATTKAGRLSEKIKEINKGLNGLGNSNKNISKMSNGVAMIARQFLTWMVILPFIMKSITALTTFLGQSLVTNNQFSNSLAQIKSNLYTAFMPIYQAILPAINTLMSALSTATAYIASFISSIFGKTFVQSQNAAKGLIQAKTAMGAYGDAAKKAGKETTGALAGFDEINLLNNNKNSGDDSSSKIPQIVSPNIDTSDVQKKTDELANRMKSVLGTIFNPFKEAWARDGNGAMEEFREAVEKSKATLRSFFDMLATPPVQAFLQNIGRLGIALGKLALSIYNNFILPIINWVISIIPSISKGLNPLLDWIVNFINKISDSPGAITGMISVILGLVAGFKAMAIVLQVSKWITTMIVAITELIAGLSTTVLVTTGVIGAIVALVVAFGVLYASNENFRNKVNEVGRAIGEFLSPVFEKLKEVVMDVWNNAIVPLGNALLDIWHMVIEPLSAILKDVFVMAFSAVIEVAKILWKNVLEPLIDFLADIFIKEIQAVIDIYYAWKPAIQTVIDIIMFLWNYALKPLIAFLGSVFLGTFEGVATSIKNIIGDIKTIFGGVIDFIAGVFTGNWSRAWQGVRDIFRGIFGALGDIAKSPLNAVIGLINGAIRGINKISFDVPDWVPSWAGGGKHFGVNLPNIPYLAQGGYVGANDPRLAVIGDNKREGEIVSPESKIYEQTFRAISDALGSRTDSQGGDLTIMIDGSAIGKVALNQLRKMQRSGGITLIPS
ncbi:hypothetical protein [Clostridium intestinale]|nr:hypothetical protein [Clostridium intestinale]